MCSRAKVWSSELLSPTQTQQADLQAALLSSQDFWLAAFSVSKNSDQDVGHRNSRINNGRLRQEDCCDSWPVWAMYWVTDHSRLQHETMPQKIKMKNLCQIESKSYLLVKRCLLLLFPRCQMHGSKTLGDCWAPNKTVWSLPHGASYHSWNRGSARFLLRVVCS